jgi:hypothetical protein
MWGIMFNECHHDSSDGQETECHTRITQGKDLIIYFLTNVWV